MFPVPKIEPGETLSAGLLNQLASRANDNRTVTGDGEIVANRAGGMTGIEDARAPSVNDLDAFLRVSSSYSAPSGGTATGWYNGRVFWRQSWGLNSSAAFAVPLENTLPEFDDCFIVNSAEHNGAVSPIKCPAYMNGRLVGYSTGTTPKPVYVVREKTDIGMIPVSITLDSGADGSATSTPSYTYKWPVALTTGVEVKKADGSRATGLSPEWLRDTGQFFSATKGTLYIGTDNDPHLWQANELRRTCTQSGA